MNSETNTVTFIKVKEDAASSKFPCLECKQLCSGYWTLNKYSGIHRPYPFCQGCLERGLDKPQAKYTSSLAAP